MKAIDAKDRAALAALADILIPPEEGHLSASEAGVAGAELDRLLSARPDLAPELARILRAAQDREPAATIAEMRADRPRDFAVLAEVVAGAYFLNPRVRAAIGYAGQDARPIDPHPDWLDDGLLTSVIARGPIYRPTP